MGEIHKKIGICPQFSILWDTLTCREHLLFFARLKGVPDQVQEQFVRATLKRVGLGLAVRNFLP
jgi:ABC-type multidrug transport system ATPase subunit